VTKEFEKFIKSEFGLEIWAGGKIIFRSRKSGIQGLLQFIKKNKKPTKDLIIFDKKVGNAAALLCTYLKTKEVCGVVGSKSAEITLKKNKIKFHFSKTIPYILNQKGIDICPMEKLSLLKTPKAFLNLLKIKGYY